MPEGGGGWRSRGVYRSEFSPTIEMTPEEFQRVTDVTYLGAVYGTLVLVPYAESLSLALMVKGVFEETEQEMVTNVLNLDQRTVAEVLTPRSDIVFLDAEQSFERNRDVLSRSPHSVVPLCDGGLDRVIGFVRSTEILTRLMAGGPIDWPSLAEAVNDFETPRVNLLE